MDKLFHVFISSTYSDLQEERRRVSEALSKAGQVPEGMEIFPASSQKQVDFIKRVIDRCDYYVIILAGRYGSTIPTGESFTELEYEYAVQKGLPTLAFLHSEPEKLEQAKLEMDAAKSTRLATFRQRIEHNSLVDYWIAPSTIVQPTPPSRRARRKYATPLCPFAIGYHCHVTPHALPFSVISTNVKIAGMTTAEDIEKAVEKLAPRELARFRAWFEAFDAEQFDAAIERDISAGKLDAHAEEAFAGLSRDL